MTTSIPGGSTQTIVAGLQKLQQLSPQEEGQFLKALKEKNKAKLTLADDKILSIRLLDATFINKKSDLFEQIEKHQVIYVITHNKAKEYIAANSTAAASLKDKTVTILTQEALDEITDEAKKLAATLLEPSVSVEAPVKKPDAHAASPHMAQAKTPESKTPAAPALDAAAPPSVVVDAALTKGREKALKRTEEEEAHIEKDKKISEEKKALEKEQEIKKKEQDHQEKRIEATKESPTSQALPGDETVT